jgi:hypothetical protein
MNQRMNATVIERALQRVGEVVEYHAEVEVLLVGGAAAMLTNLLAPNRTTVECDVMVYQPESAMAAAERVAAEQGLVANWLNSDVQMLVGRLPEGWRARRVFVGEFGKLRVWAANRLDLLAMKVIAGRAQDVEDIRAMRMRADEAPFVRGYVESLRGKEMEGSSIEDALELLDALELHERE